MSKKITLEEIKEVWQEIRDEAELFTAEIVLEKMDLFLEQQKEREQELIKEQEFSKKAIKMNCSKQKAYSELEDKFVNRVNY